MHLLTTAAWYSTWSSIVWGLHSHTNAARRPQFTMQTALQHHLIICTEDVTGARRTLQGYIQIFSRDTTASSATSSPRTSANILVFFILCLRRRYAATATVTAATQSSGRNRKPFLIKISDSPTLLENQDFLTGWVYQKILLENVLLEKAYSGGIRSGFLVPYQKSRFLITFSNSIRSGLRIEIR